MDYSTAGKHNLSISHPQRAFQLLDARLSRAKLRFQVGAFLPQREVGAFAVQAGATFGFEPDPQECGDAARAQECVNQSRQKGLKSRTWLLGEDARHGRAT